MSRYVDVVITRETQPVSEKGFGMPLVLATGKALEYTVYTDISEVADDFAVTTPEYKLLSRMFGQEPSPKEIACYGVAYVAGTDEASDLVTALNTLIQTNNDFYYLVCPEHSDDEIEALAGWAETQDKIYGTTTTNVTLAETLKGLYNNTFISVHNDADSYHAEGLIGLNAPKTIGSFTWTFKRVSGVTKANYTNAQVNAIIAANATTCVSEGGILLNAKGVVTNGEYIDNIQATHFLKARLTEAVFRLLATKEKVPYTDAGISLVVAEVQKVLMQGYRQGIIADDDVGNPMFTITAPKRSEILTNSIANRVLPDIKWTAIVAGAIEKVEIRGVLTL